MPTTFAPSHQESKQDAKESEPDNNDLRKKLLEMIRQNEMMRRKPPK